VLQGTPQLRKHPVLRLGLFSIVYLIFFEVKIVKIVGFRKIISFEIEIKKYTKLFEKTKLTTI
jgi:hypothetical protein